MALTALGKIKKHIADAKASVSRAEAHLELLQLFPLALESFTKFQGGSERTYQQLVSQKITIEDSVLTYTSEFSGKWVYAPERRAWRHTGTNEIAGELPPGPW